MIFALSVLPAPDSPDTKMDWSAAPDAAPLAASTRPRKRPSRVDEVKEAPPEALDDGDDGDDAPWERDE